MVSSEDEALVLVDVVPLVAAVAAAVTQEDDAVELLVLAAAVFLDDAEGSGAEDGGAEDGVSDSIEDGEPNVASASRSFLIIL